MLVISWYSSLLPFLLCYSLFLFTASFVCPHENNVFIGVLHLGGAAPPRMPFMICAYCIIIQSTCNVLFALINFLSPFKY